MRAPLIVLVFAVLIGRPIAAQEPPRLRVAVRQVAGATLYLDAGTAAGLATGDSVPALRGDSGPPIGVLVVTAASETRSVLTAPPTLRIAAGDTLTLLLRRPPTAPQGAPPSARAPAPVTEARSPRREATARPRPPASGRLALDLSAGQSWARAAGTTESRTHTTANPALRLDLTVPGLAAGFRLRTSARLAYRHHALGAPATSLRVYSAALERQTPGSPLQVTIGRFQSPDESFSGFWDGARVRFGGDVGVAVLLGLQPDLWNERPTLDRPKATVVLDGTARGGGWRWFGNASAHRVAGSGGAPAHDFFGVTQSLSGARGRIGHDAQVDRDPATGAWHLSRLALRGALRLTDALEVRAGYQRRTAYLEDSIPPYFAPLSERTTLGLALGIGRGRLSGDVARTEDLRGATLAYTASAWVPLEDRGPAALDASAWYGQGPLGDSWTVAPGVGIGIGRARLRAGYRHARAEFVGHRTVDHGIDLSADVPWRDGMRATLRLRGQYGSTLSSAAVDVSLQRSF